jgi:hypothetical protein
MKANMKTLTALILGIASLSGGTRAIAQSTDSGTSNATKAKTAQAAKNFAAEEKLMQDASRSSASGAVASPATQATPLNKNRNAGAGGFDSEMALQKQKPSPKVDKNAKAADPIKSISKMTPEERAQLRSDVVKESKP